MNTTPITDTAIAALELLEDGLRKIIYTSDRLQQKLELRKLAVVNDEQRKAEDKLNKLRLAFDELERKRIPEAKAVIAKAKAARLAHDQYAEKAVSRGWMV